VQCTPVTPCQPGIELQVRRPAYKALLHPLVMALMQQYRSHEVYQQQLLQLVNTLLAFVTRNIALNRSVQITENID
jgi:hypothetical protein